MENETKLVDFVLFCKQCKNYTKIETEEPCNECLTYPTNINSHTPILFEKK